MKTRSFTPHNFIFIVIILVYEVCCWCWCRCRRSRRLLMSLTVYFFHQCAPLICSLFCLVITTIFFLVCFFFLSSSSWLLVRHELYLYWCYNYYCCCYCHCHCHCHCCLLQPLTIIFLPSQAIFAICSSRILCKLFYQYCFHCVCAVLVLLPHRLICSFIWISVLFSLDGYCYKSIANKTKYTKNECVKLLLLRQLVSAQAILIIKKSRFRNWRNPVHCALSPNTSTRTSTKHKTTTIKTISL